MELLKLLSILPTYQVDEDIEQIDIKAIEMDNRKVAKGDLFVCIKGFTVDGHDYAAKAVEAGAIAVMAEKELPHISVPIIIVEDTTRALAMLATKFLNFPSDHLSLIGITGTNGKTTVTYLLEKIFQTNEQKTGLMGTIQMKIGEEIYPVVNTTPDALMIQKNLHKMVEKEVDVAVMEVSSHALDLGRVFGCNFDMAVYTNLSQDHLDFHKNISEYLRAKSLLFSQLGNAYSSDQAKYAVINRDDPYAAVIEKSTSQKVVTYGIENPATIMAKDLELHLHETTFTLSTPEGEVSLTSSLIGRFNVYNMLTAASVAWARGISLATIKEALESIQGVQGRFEQVNAGQDFATIVDYAHTPDSLENVLQTIKDLTSEKVYVVIGCGGDRDRSKRPLMAEIALKYADLAYFTTDNPRTEDPVRILTDMTNDLEEDHYEVIIDRKAAIEEAVKQAKTNDVLLIAGKGHETYQEVNGVRFDFDDHKVARDSIVSQKKGSSYEA